MKDKTFTGELIGKEIKIISSKDQSILGLEGKIVDETKNTIKIRAPIIRTITQLNCTSIAPFDSIDHI